MEAQDDPRFLKGIEEFNQQLFFECHETLEEIWLEDHGDNRQFYQGIIQIAAGYFKWQQGVPAGAIKLWRLGLQKIEALAEAVKKNLAELESCQQSGAVAPSLDVPSIHLIC